MKTIHSVIPEGYEELRSEYIEVADRNITLEKEIDSLKHQLTWLKKQVFGAKNEAFHKAPDVQEDLFSVKKAQKPKTKEQKVSGHTRIIKEAKPGKKPLPDSLPRRQTIHDIENKACDCGSELRVFSEDIHEELNYIPPQLEVIEHVYPKYSCPCCHDKVYQAESNASPIEKGRPSASLLAHVNVSKYQDHLPLDRISHQFRRYDVDIADSTLNYWVKKSSLLLEPIYYAIKSSVLKSKYVLSDDTGIKVQNEGSPGKCHNGFVWVYGNLKEAFYQYTKGRSREGPKSILKDFKGILQTDGYAGYNEIVKSNDIVQVGCMAHVRRKFFELKDSNPDEIKPLLKMIAGLYEIERENQGDDKALALARTQQSSELFCSLEEMISSIEKRVLPSSNLGKAVHYALNQLPKIKMYLENPLTRLDNNFSERLIKPFVIGRKNWLFFSRHNTSKRHMILFSIIESCKLAGVNSYRYLTDVLSRIQDHPVKKVSELTPLNWKASQDGVN